MRKMRPAGQGKRSPGRPGRGVWLNNVMTRGVAVGRDSPARVTEEVDVSVSPLVGDVGSFLSDVVSPMVADGVPLANGVDEVAIDSVGVPPLAAARGEGLLVDIAVAAFLAVAEVASSADFAGVAPSADFAGMCATPAWQAQRIVPSDVTSLRRRLPKILFATMHKRQADMENLRRACRHRPERALSHGRPGNFPPV